MPLLPETPIMKFSRLFVHHNTAPKCIVMVRQPGSCERLQHIDGFGLQMHRIGDRLLGACA